MRLLKDRRGGTAIEYTLLACVVAIGIIAALTSMSDSVANMFAQAEAAFPEEE